MKVYISICLFAFGFAASAKTAEQGHSCFYLDSSVFASQIPQKICFQSVKVLPFTNDAVVMSYLQPELFMESKLDYLARKNEDGYIFMVSNVILNKWETGCSEGRKQEILISGFVNNDGYSEDWSLKVSIVETTTNDTCHSPESSVTYTYK
jgi:hypothetical protein